MIKIVLSIAVSFVFTTSAYAQLHDLKPIYSTSTNRTVSMIRDGRMDYKVDIFRGDHWAGGSNDLVLQISSPPTRFDVPRTDQQTESSGLASNVEVKIQASFEKEDVTARLCCSKEAPQVETSWRHFRTCLLTGCAPSLYLVVLKGQEEFEDCPILISIGDSTFKIGTEIQEYPEAAALNGAC